jgi:hypothetical protein
MIKKAAISIVMSTLITLTVMATTFSPVPLDRQLRESDGVVHAKYLGATYKKLPSGEIVTMGSFEIIKSIGVRNSDIINKNSFMLMYPGGIWQDQGYQVHGAPEFKENEESILILKKTDIGYRIKGLSLGKYSFFKGDGAKDIYISSSVFPNHPKLGRMAVAEFESVLEQHFGEDFTAINSDKYVYSEEKRKISDSVRAGRRPASFKKDVEKEVSGNKLHINWLVLLLGSMGVLSLHLARRSKRK